MAQGLLNLEQVLEIIPYSKTEWYRGMKEGVFPRPLMRRPDKPDSRGVCWRFSDIEEVIQWIGSNGTVKPSFSRGASGDLKERDRVKFLDSSPNLDKIHP